MASEYKCSLKIITEIYFNLDGECKYHISVYIFQCKRSLEKNESLKFTPMWMVNISIAFLYIFF